jgi:5'-3' exonuclease
LILLSYLLGSDYSDGIKGVGPMTAMEILVACQSLASSVAPENEYEKDASTAATNNQQLLDPLIKFATWLKDDSEKTKLEVEFDCMQKLKKKKATLSRHFPNPKIFDYYASMSVLY